MQVMAFLSFGIRGSPSGQEAALPEQSAFKSNTGGYVRSSAGHHQMPDATNVRRTKLQTNGLSRGLTQPWRRALISRAARPTHFHGQRQAVIGRMEHP